MKYPLIQLREIMWDRDLHWQVEAKEKVDGMFHLIAEANTIELAKEIADLIKADPCRIRIKPFKHSDEPVIEEEEPRRTKKCKT